MSVKSFFKSIFTGLIIIFNFVGVERFAVSPTNNGAYSVSIDEHYVSNFQLIDEF